MNFRKDIQATLQSLRDVVANPVGAGFAQAQP